MHKKKNKGVQNNIQYKLFVTQKAFRALRTN